ncbi:MULTISPECIES: ABC transporter substrate-binding protein [unclassified Streptomyces]|uniref:ABC transporter substrate-binding protein n=1 Tax=Streptomyces sp. NBC_00119 TaxID=2975659 RepID=A0AAU1U2J2_9ACTN|nr:MULTISPECIES: ABC transporter substrate-binding protein [unclassified Streptomyces]MCX4641915.1 ABC transporter substrate-binding protein [Streptomyces sp. NBC_01446]MCX5321640.1 ABC transporter substrate-binding protein [Streptomyces sp. NBC_00120]
MTHAHARTSTATTAVPDTLWFTRCPVPTATGIAADQQWLTAEFAPDGIAVRSLQDADRDVDRRTHYTHALPGLFREGGNVPALWARSRGEETRLVGLTWIEERQTILVAPGSGIRGAAALRGLRIAAPRHRVAIDFWRAMALRGFEGALASAGLGLDDAILVDVPAEGHTGQWAAELAALQRGDVDAVYVKGALSVEAARRIGAEVALELDELPDRRHRVNNGTPRPITVHRRLLDDHPDLVDRFLAVLLRAADWAADRPDDVARILGAETGAGAEGVAGAYRTGTHRTLHPDLSEDRLALLAQQSAALHAHGFLPEPVDVRDWADPAPLHRARLLHPTPPASSRPAL